MGVDILSGILLRSNHSLGLWNWNRHCVDTDFMMVIVCTASFQIAAESDPEVVDRLRHVQRLDEFFSSYQEWKYAAGNQKVQHGRRDHSDRSGD